MTAFAGSVFRAGQIKDLMEVTDSTFGCLGDPKATEEGWRMLFESGFKV